MANKIKTGPATTDPKTVGRVVLVGTYKGDQLKDWPGWYCWPLDGDDCRGAGGPPAAENSHRGTKVQRETLAQSPQSSQSSLESSDNLRASVPLCETNTGLLPSVTELRLYRGTADERRYRAEFVGVRTREELIRDYGYPGGDVSATKNAKCAKGGSRLSRPPKPHGTHYALFKTELLYRHKNAPQEEADAVIVRLKDFARSPKVRKQLREYLQSPDRNDPDLAKLLPSIVTSVPPERLRVCEGAVQLDFSWIFRQQEIQEHASIAAVVSIKAKRENKLTCVEICAGAGGQAIGLDMAGFEHVALVLKAS